MADQPVSPATPLPAPREEGGAHPLRALDLVAAASPHMSRPLATSASVPSTVAASSSHSASSLSFIANTHIQLPSEELTVEVERLRRQMRDVGLRAGQLQEQVDRAAHSSAASAAELSQLGRRNAELERRHQDVQAEVDRLEKLLATKDAEVSTLRRNLQTQQERVSELEREVDRLSGALRVANDARVAAERALDISEKVAQQLQLKARFREHVMQTRQMMYDLERRLLRLAALDPESDNVFCLRDLQEFAKANPRHAAAEVWRNFCATYRLDNRHLRLFQHLISEGVKLAHPTALPRTAADAATVVNNVLAGQFPAGVIVRADLADAVSQPRFVNELVAAWQGLAVPPLAAVVLPAGAIASTAALPPPSS